MSDVSEWKTEKGGYRYPYRAMENLDTMEDRFAVCQIPSELLENINSGDLLKVVLDYPMLDYMKYWNSIYEGIQEVENNFNGMKELTGRFDFYKTVVKYYKHMTIPKTKKIDSDKMNQYEEEEIIKDDALMEQVEEDMKVVNTILFCETVLTSMTDNIDQSTLKEAKKVLMQKKSEVKKTEFYENIKTERWQLKESSYADKRMITDF